MISSKPEDILFNRCKNAIGFDSSEEYRKWFKDTFPEYEQHHIFGSYTSLKTTDYCSMPLTREQHIFAENHKSEFAFTHYHIMLQTMISYIKHLEKRLE